MPVEAELVSLTGIREHSMTQHDTEESTENRPTEGCRVMQENDNSIVVTVFTIGHFETCANFVLSTENTEAHTVCM